VNDSSKPPEKGERGERKRVKENNYLLAKNERLVAKKKKHKSSELKIKAPKKRQ